jgi:arylsulfatase A-like enzyme
MSTEVQPKNAACWSGLPLSQFLGLAFLAGCLWWNYREFLVSFVNHPVLPSLTVQEHLASGLMWRLAAFLLAAWLVHALLGIVAFGLARLTESALSPRFAVRRSFLIGGWFALLAGLAFAANTTWHPASLYAGNDSVWRQPWFGQPRIAWLVLLLALVVLLLAWIARTRIRMHLRSVAISTALMAVILAAILLPPVGRSDARTIGTDRPHIVIIGIDSLRSDLSLPQFGTAGAPAVREFLKGARRFEDVTSPLPRTYGAWVSILTGRHPVTTNARVNLMPRQLVREGETLPAALRANGYRTIYATDETRFANFDATYGFDRLIMPPVGAADFLLGFAGDMPLVNMVAATPFGGLLFPSNHANRGYVVTYRPAHFVRRLEREIAIDAPTFLTVHLTLAHWPYAWAGTDVPTQPAQYRAAYAEAVAEVDRQYSDVMRLLSSKGVLENAIVVLLSDHGEALGGEDDSMLRQTGASREIWDSLWGHGTSVMSPHQFQVLLAVRAFGRARLPGPERDYDWPVTLEDLRPTLEELATGDSPAAVDGLSLVPFMEENARASVLTSRIRFTETDFNTPRTLAGRYEVSGIVDEAAVFYEIDRASGWVQFRSDRLPDLLAAKQRAAFSPGSLLAAIPSPSGGTTRFLFTSRREPHPQTLEGSPGNWTQTEARRLWGALNARYPGELPGSSDLPRM